MPRLMACRRASFAGALVLLTATPSAADVLPYVDNGALSGSFHLPSATEGTAFPRPGRAAFSVTAITSSHASGELAGSENLTLDGETSRLLLGVRYGVGERFEIGMEVPYAWHSAGRLDSFIDDWHDLVGLTGGVRSVQPKDRLAYTFGDESGQRFRVVEGSEGIGDLRLVAGWRFGGTPEHGQVLRIGATLPTGDSETLHGSGAPGLSLGLAGDLSGFGDGRGLNAFYSVHAVYLGTPDLLADRHRRFAWSAFAGFGFAVSPRIELRLQGNARSAIYESAIEILGETSATLTVGANFAPSERYLLSFGITEDVKVQSAPDVSFLAGIRYTPGE